MDVKANAWENFRSAPRDGTRIIALCKWSKYASPTSIGKPYVCLASYMKLGPDGEKQWMFETGIGASNAALIPIGWQKMPEPGEVKS
jgi:hypothetical protein